MAVLKRRVSTGTLRAIDGGYYTMISFEAGVWIIVEIYDCGYCNGIHGVV